MTPCGRCNTNDTFARWACCPEHQVQYNLLCKNCKNELHPETKEFKMTLPNAEVPIPETIDILGRVYTVHESWDEYPARTTSSPNVQGTCSWMKLCIYINPDHALTNRKSTLIHEILHGLLSFAKDPDGDGHKNEFRDNNEIEEYICASLDDGLGYVLSKNPDLLAFLGQ